VSQTGLMPPLINGSDWFLSGAPDPRWDNDELHTMKAIKGRDFEVVEMGEIITE